MQVSAADRPIAFATRKKLKICYSTNTYQVCCIWRLDTMDVHEKSLSDFRGSVIDKLSYNYAHGVLEENEFEQLLEQVTEAETYIALETIDRMFPPVPLDTARQSDTARQAVPARRAGSFLFTMFGGTERRGRSIVPEHTTVVTIFGGADLDLSQCVFEQEEICVQVFCAFGGVDIIVPDNAEVIVEGIPILGGFEDSSRPLKRGGPCIRVRGFVAFGGVEVRNMKKKERLRLQGLR